MKVAPLIGLQLLLFLDWIRAGVEGAYVPVLSSSTPPDFSEGVTWTWAITLQNGVVVSVERQQKGPIKVTSSDAGATPSLAALVHDARQKALEWKTGEETWWSAYFRSERFGLAALVTEVQGLRKNAEQVLKHGKRRLGSDGVITFQVLQQDGAPVGDYEGSALDVRAVFRTLGPVSEGLFGRAHAENWTVLIRAVCALAIGARLEAAPWSTLYPAAAEEIEDAEKDLAGPLPELVAARKGGDLVALWPRLGSLDSGDSLPRAARALWSYEHALSEQTAEAATIFLVTALEALAHPAADWYRERVAPRFVQFVGQLSEETIGDIMRHANFPLVFGRVTSPRAFLNKVYDLRSRPLHEGVSIILPSLGMVRPKDQACVLLTSWLAREAILDFLLAPRSSLIGHPKVWPSSGVCRPGVQPSSR